MAYQDLSEEQRLTLERLIDTEIISIDTAIQGNNEMADEYKDKPALQQRILEGNEGLKKQLEHLKGIEDTLRKPSHYLTSLGLLSDRDCLLKVRTHDSDFLHQSWMVNGEVMSYENLPCNYPAGHWSAYPTKEEYFDAIRNVDWINAKEYIEHNNIEALCDVKFPFIEEDE